MKINKSAIVFFSPTGTSGKVAMAIGEGSGYTPRVADATYTTPRNLDFDSDELVLVAVPVYGGKVAPLALQRMEAMRGNGTPAVCVVVYGNRDYEGAMQQLNDFLARRGFVTIAAAAFVGEHSYSTPKNPIAAGRPDMEDIAEARKFGQEVAAKLSNATNLQAIDVAQLARPNHSLWSKLRFIWFILRRNRLRFISFRTVPSVAKPAPVVDMNRCKACGKCARFCPNGAISANGIVTDPDRCIKCCACVKLCPTKARTFDTPYAPVLSRCFTARTSPVTLL